MKASQSELGEIDDGKDEVVQLQKSIFKAKMTKAPTKTTETSFIEISNVAEPMFFFYSQCKIQ